MDLDQDAVALQAANWSKEIQAVRLYGRPIRFSNRVHPLYTDQTQCWCFTCHTETIPLDDACAECGQDTINDYCHFKAFDTPDNWPVLWLLDPHPRKPHMYLWVTVGPDDDLWVQHEGECDGDLGDVHADVAHTEESYRLNVAERIIDPNMGRSPASSKREITWQDEFMEAGLSCDLAEDSDVGRSRLNEFLKPDPSSLRPRIHIHERCQMTNYQMKRYTWEDHKQSLEKDQKQKARPKYDDYPTLLKYLMNRQPLFADLVNGPVVINRLKRGAY